MQGFDVNNSSAAVSVGESVFVFFVVFWRCYVLLRVHICMFSISIRVFSPTCGLHPTSTLVRYWYSVVADAKKRTVRYSKKSVVELL